MKTPVTLRSARGHVVMPLPKSILDLLGLVSGSKVDLSVEDGRLIVEPRTKPKYTLDELLAECRPSALIHRRADKAWLRGGPVGRERL